MNANTKTRKGENMTRDIKQATLAKLRMIREEMQAGEARYQMDDLIDSLASSMVTVTYSRPDIREPMPGEAMTAEELVLNNVD